MTRARGVLLADDDKVTALVRPRFGGDNKAAFADYGADGNGLIDGGEL